MTASTASSEEMRRIRRVKFLGEETLRVLSENPDCEITESQGFNSANKFSQVRIDSRKDFLQGRTGKLTAAAKKALDAAGNEIALDQAKLGSENQRAGRQSDESSGFRLFGKEPDGNQINDDLVLIGLVAIRDHVRPEKRAMLFDEVQQAGIRWL